MKRKNTYRSYFTALALGIFIFLGAGVILNCYADPFMYLRAHKIDETINHNPLFREQIRISKANQLALTQPCALILGSSRTEYGLNPAHDGFACKAVYNAAIPSPNMYEIYRYFQHALAVKKPQQVVLPLDFFVFDLSGNENSPDFIEEIFAVDPQGRPQNRYGFDFMKKMTSADVLGWSLKRLLNPDADGPYRHNGFRDVSYKARAFYETDKETHRDAFEGSEMSFYKLFADGFDTRQNGIDTLEIYNRLLELAYENDVDLRLLISPSHARMYETIAVAGLYERWEDWKREIVSMNEKAAKKYDKTPYVILDFSGYSKYTTEKLPRGSAESKPMTWWWESSHYKSNLGDMVLERALLNKDVAGFGVRLDNHNMEQHLKNIRLGRERWRRDNPQDVAYIEALKNITVK